MDVDCTSISDDIPLKTVELGNSITSPQDIR